MLTGKHFRLDTTTCAAEHATDHPQLVMVPADSVVKVLDEPAGEYPQKIQVSWNGRVLWMFEIDVRTRGEEVFEPTSFAKPWAARSAASSA